MNNYAGKVCPYCRRTFVASDDVVICNVCGVLHHKQCWFNHRGCNTYGCNGGMTALLPYDDPQYDNARHNNQQSTFAFCIYCGSRHSVNDTFCNKCGKKIRSAPISSPEDPNKQNYDRAVRFFEAGQFDEALHIFNGLAGYSDSSEKARACITEKENLLKDAKYSKAVTLLSSSNATDVDLKNAITDLRSISDYKDSEGKVLELEKRLEMWYEAKKNAEEAAAEALRKKQYDTAVSYFCAGRIDEAFSIFTSLGNYSDAANKAKMCIIAKENLAKERVYSQAVAYISAPNVTDEELKGAISDLKSIEDYKDSKDKITKLEKRLEIWYEMKKATEEAARRKHYNTAVSYFASRRFDEAIKIFSALGDYSDSKIQIQNCLSAKEEARKEKLYKQAVLILSSDTASDNDLMCTITVLNSIVEYKDSKEKLILAQKRLKKWRQNKTTIEDAAKARTLKTKSKAIRRIIICSVSVLILAALVIGAWLLTKPF